MCHVYHPRLVGTKDCVLYTIDVSYILLYESLLIIRDVAVLNMYKL